MRNQQIRRNWKWLLILFGMGVIIFLSSILILIFGDSRYQVLGIFMLLGGFVLSGGLGKTIIEYYFQLRREKKEDDFKEHLFEQLTEGINDDTLRRIIPVDIPKNFHISDIDCAIVSIHARWSGYSVMEGKMILKLLEESDNQKIPIYIIDIDHFPGEMQKEKLGFISHGYFESVFVENGEIIRDWPKQSITENQIRFREYLKKKLSKERDQY